VHLSQQDIVDWLATLGIGNNLTVNVPVYIGPYVQEMPDLQAVVTAIGGLGESMQGIADTPGFQLRVQGRQLSNTSPEDVALQADRLILTAPLPALVGGVWMGPVQRSGGRPAPLPSRDSGDRVIYTATYLCTFIY
jgi:hypothetical protein